MHDVSTYTTNYSLKKPDADDKVQISDINRNMDIIDTKIKEVKDVLDRSASAITLSASGWSGSPGSYTQTVTASGVTASNDVIIGCAGTISFEASAQIGANVVRASAQRTNALTFTAAVKPTVDIPLVFRII